MTISIHALVKRATDTTKRERMIKDISIHALVKRATEPLHNDSEGDMHFNPRPRKEGDLPKSRVRKFVFAFQSTPS